MRIPFSALLGLCLTGAFVFVAVFAQWIAPYPTDAAVGGVWEGPSARFWLGTDTIGRDILSRMIYGGQITIVVALVSSLLSFGLGAFFGFLSVVRGAWVDTALSRLVDLMMAVPSLIVALVVLSVLPLNLIVLILVMGILDSTRVFRLSRAVAADFAVMDYVEAARLRGENLRWIIFREILPERAVAAGRRVRPALHLCSAVHLDAVIPGLGHSAAPVGLGRHSAREQGWAGLWQGRRDDACGGDCRAGDQRQSGGGPGAVAHHQSERGTRCLARAAPICWKSGACASRRPLVRRERHRACGAGR